MARLILSIMLVGACSITAADRFDLIKSNLAAAPCTEFQFLNIIESNIFDEVDSTWGTALLAADGRYDIGMAADRYIFDGSRTYGYSAENNQVSIEKTDSTATNSDQFSFIVRLDDWYDSTPLVADSAYTLIKKSNISSDIPDSMTIFIARSQMRIGEIVYFDINDDLNRIVIVEQTITETCPKERFKPDFPDSVEVVRF